MDVDLLAPEAVADPHALFHRLRAEDPVHWSDRSRAWVVTRYDDVTAGFRSPLLSAERIVRAGSDDPTLATLSRWLVFNDPPEHTRLRRLVGRAFTPRAVERLRRRVAEVAGDLVTGLERAGGGDLVADVAFPLPAIVIAELLGAPPEDRDRFKSWSDDIGTVVFGATNDPGRYERARRGMDGFVAYFRHLIARYARTPEDNLISAMVATRDQGDHLTTDEIVATSILLLFAGHETTTNLIGNAVLALHHHPDQRARLADDPSLMPSAVEEFLRFDGPTKLMVRLVHDDLVLGGRQLRAGERVFLANTAANRDPGHFADPDRLDVGRRPNDHVGFGYGIHHCLGAPLARLEAQLALSALVTRLPTLQVATGDLRYDANILGRGLKELPVTL